MLQKGARTCSGDINVIASARCVFCKLHRPSFSILGHAEPEVTPTGQGRLQDCSYVAEMPRLWEVMRVPTAAQGRGAGVLTAPGEPPLELAGHGPTVEQLVLRFLWSLHKPKCVIALFILFYLVQSCSFLAKKTYTWCPLLNTQHFCYPSPNL